MDAELFRGGFPDSTARVADMLAQPEQLESIIDGMSAFYALYTNAPSIMRFRIKEPSELLARLDDLRIESIAFTAGDLPLKLIFMVEENNDFLAVLEHHSTQIVPKETIFGKITKN